MKQASHRSPQSLVFGALPLSQASIGSDMKRASYRSPQSLVGDTRFELVTSSVSGKRATTAPAAQGCCEEVGTGFEPVYTDLQSVASPLGHPTSGVILRPSPSGQRDSNPRPSPWQGDALPTEPCPHALNARHYFTQLATIGASPSTTSKSPTLKSDSQSSRRHIGNKNGTRTRLP